MAYCEETVIMIQRLCTECTNQLTISECYLDIIFDMQMRVTKFVLDTFEHAC